MARHAKKSTHKLSAKPALHTAEAIQEAEAKVLKIGRDSMEDVMSATDSISRAARECVGMCSDNLGTLVECGSKASNIFQDISNEAMESVNRAFSDYAEYAHDAFACRTINDIVKLQSNLVQRRMDSYFEEGSKLCNLLFDGCEQMLEPLNERTAIASEQFRKALAA